MVDSAYSNSLARRKAVYALPISTYQGVKVLINAVA